MVIFHSYVKLPEGNVVNTKTSHTQLLLDGSTFGRTNQSNHDSNTGNNLVITIRVIVVIAIILLLLIITIIILVLIVIITLVWMIIILIVSSITFWGRQSTSPPQRWGSCLVVPLCRPQQGALTWRPCHESVCLSPWGRIIGIFSEWYSHSTFKEVS